LPGSLGPLSLGAFPSPADRPLCTKIARTLMLLMEPADRKFPVIAADLYVIGADTPVGLRKLLQVICTANDGSIYVAFPYAQLGAGTIGVARIDPAPNVPRTITVGHDFPATVHTVKYAHHASGQAHFSLDGKIFTQIRREAAPLNEVNGHLFSVMLQGFNQFEPLDPGKRNKKRRSTVVLALSDAAQPAVKIVGRLYREDRAPLAALHDVPGSTGYSVATEHGVVPGVLLLTSLRSGGRRWFLLITMESIPLINHQGEAFMTFMGGFDHECVAFDHSLPLECLMFFYPHRGDLQHVIDRAGTVDRS
jgi:hypothetical protein